MSHKENTKRVKGHIGIVDKVSEKRTRILVSITEPLLCYMNSGCVLVRPYSLSPMARLADSACLFAYMHLTLQMGSSQMRTHCNNLDVSWYAETHPHHTV